MVESTTPPEELLAGIPGRDPTDNALVALADPERRRLLRILRDLETAERLTALARSLAVELEDTDADRLLIRLHHVHVPKLESVGIVDFDAEERFVSLTERGERIADAV